MYFLSLCQQILYEMWAQKMRSLLALFGIVWGTITVVLLLSLGTGFHQATRRDVMQISEGTFFVRPRSLSKSYMGLPKGAPLKIRAREIMVLPKNVPDIVMASPILVNNTTISAGNNQTSGSTYGVSKDFAKMRKIVLEPNGRFIDPLDIAGKKRVVILGDKLAQKLFGKKMALGQTVDIKKVRFTIIGVISAGRSIRDFYENNAIIPYTTSISLWGDQSVSYFVALPDPNADPVVVQNTMVRYFAHKLHYDPTDTVALRVYDTTKMFQFFKWFFIGVQIFLGVCGALTLGVGGLSVANIMFLIVTERTREIGLRFAVGATDWHVMLQILLEALIIVVMGGFLGFLISYITVEVLQYVTLPEWLGKPSISIVSVCTTILVLSALGVLAGYFPARRASKMDPVEALGF